MQNLKQALSVVLCGVLVTSSMGLDGCKKEATKGVQTAPAATYAVPTPDQLYQLVSPIALFPDNLLAQVLAASTFPDQVTAAWNFLQQNHNLQGQQLMQAVDQQNWDVSVKGLTQFSDVVQQMASNLSWTSALGDAYFNAPKDVMNAVQVMRQRAYDAGNLKSGPQQNVVLNNQPPAPQAAPAAQGATESSGGGSQVTVVQAPPQTIVIQPSQPDVVYVPTYNPTAVYGAPVAAPPGYSSGDMAVASLLSFGVGIAVGAAINNNNNCCGWGWNSWNCGWHGGGVMYQNNVYISNSNTFVNRNNYYNNNVNNINRNNINANNINTNNINRNNINTNNISRNNINQNNLNRAGVNSGTTPQFNQNRNQSQYGGQARGNDPQARQAAASQQGAGNLVQQRAGTQPAFNQQQRNNLSQQRAGNQPAINAQNRAGGGQLGQGGGGQLGQGGVNQNQRQAARGYGDQPRSTAGNSALGNYGQGGNARADSARGQQSLSTGGNRSGNNTAARAGGGGASGGGGAAAGRSAGSGGRERSGRR